MKRIVVLLLTIITLLSLVSCSQKDVTTQEFIEGFELAGFPINNVQVYTENSDPNGLLGRKGQYYAKFNFNHNDIDGCTVEIFRNHNDAKRRQDYVNMVADTSNLAFLQKYMVLEKNYLLRLPHNLTPEEVLMYTTTFEQIIDPKLEVTSVSEYFDEHLSFNNIDEYKENIECEVVPIGVKQVGFRLVNHNSITIPLVDVSVVYLDDNGNMMDTVSDSIELLNPEHPVFLLPFCDLENLENYTNYEVSLSPSLEKSYSIDCMDAVKTTSSLSDNQTLVISIENTGDTTIESIDVVAVLYSHDKVIYAAHDSIFDLMPGSKEFIKFDSPYKPDENIVIDRYEYYVNEAYSY